MSIYFVIFLFLTTFCTRNLFQCEVKLLRVRLIMKKIYEQYVLFHPDVFNFLLIFWTRIDIHCGEIPVPFRLIFKYSRTFMIFIEEIKK